MVEQLCQAFNIILVKNMGSDFKLISGLSVIAENFDSHRG
jgi:hypothetical protein